MKFKNYLFIVALLGAFAFVSCTPENIEDGSTEQQVDNTLRPLTNG
ncbi:MAG: hypothetical protein HKN48_08000 [Flavobacteriaceae bacterium]|nr:hypothetical protein [Flavobacteriaceae bacterium]